MHMDSHVLLEKEGDPSKMRTLPSAPVDQAGAVANNKVFGEIHRNFVYAQGVNEVITNTSIKN